MILNESEISRALISNWKTFFPQLELIKEKFSLQKNIKGDLKEIDILAFNRPKKRFTIIELKTGKDKGQLKQAYNYKKYYQKQSKPIYDMVNSKHDHIVLPEFEKLNEAEVFLIAENFSDEILNENNLTLAKYHLFPIDKESTNLGIEYIANKPHALKSKHSCVVYYSDIRKIKFIELSRTVQVIKITFPDGEIIQEKNAIDTFIKGIKKIGIEKVRKAEVNFHKIPLFINKLKESATRKKKYLNIGECYIYKHHSTGAKVKMLKEISKKLKINIKVETVLAQPSIGNRKTEGIKKMKINLRDKILKLTEIEIAAFNTEEKELIIKKFS